MSDVFLSYASRDRDRVEQLARALERENLQVFWDRDQVEMTRSATRQMDEEIRQSRVVLLLITHTAVTSKILAEEADLALSLGILMPVWLDQVDRSRIIQFRMGSIQNLDLVDWRGEPGDRRFRFLVDEIRRRVSDRQAAWSTSPTGAAVPPYATQPMPAPVPAPQAAPMPAPAATVFVPTPAPAAVVPPAPPTSTQPVPSPAPGTAPIPASQPADPFGPLVMPPLPAAAALPVPSPAVAHFGAQPPDVFVAYSRKDSDTCRKIVGELRSQGLNVFYDQYIQGGEEWRDMLAWNIKNCSVLMVLFTGNSKNSPQVRKEVNLATSHSKSIIPVMVENVTLEGGLELELNGINFIPYFDDPPRRLSEAVEKAKTLSALSVFERRRQGLPEAPLPALAMPFTTANSAASAPVVKANWLQGALALVGGVLLAGSISLLVSGLGSGIRPELVVALALALFFVALPYMIGVLLLFRRLLRG